MTAAREFRTIKCCEFYSTGKIILDPLRSLKHYASEKHTNSINSLHYSTESMLRYLDKNRAFFNQSQQEAIERVAKMNRKDMLLIQGPPGTGKTHTIHGIISMLIRQCSRDKYSRKKILVCTPSNAAIDEIVLRLVSKRVGGAAESDSTMMSGQVIRIGAMDYEPLEAVRKHTLDYNLEL